MKCGTSSSSESCEQYISAVFEGLVGDTRLSFGKLLENNFSAQELNNKSSA